MAAIHYLGLSTKWEGGELGWEMPLSIYIYKTYRSEQERTDPKKIGSTVWSKLVSRARGRISYSGPF
jgi:hypothetical protein